MFYLGVSYLWHAHWKTTILLKGQRGNDAENSNKINSFSRLLIISFKITFKVFVWEKGAESFGIQGGCWVNKKARIFQTNKFRWYLQQEDKTAIYFLREHQWRRICCKVRWIWSRVILWEINSWEIEGC